MPSPQWDGLLVMPGASDWLSTSPEQLSVSGLQCMDSQRFVASDNSVAAVQPATALDFLNLSFKLYQAGRFADSIAAGTASLKLEPNSAAAYNNRAAAFASLRLWDSAIADAREAIRLKPDFQLAKNNLAWASQQKQQEAAALAAANPSARPRAYLDLSLQFYRTGKFPECIAAATQALRLQPNMAEAYNNIAACEGGLKLWDQAIAAARQAIRLKPDFQLAKNNLQWCSQQKAIQEKASPAK